MRTVFFALMLLSAAIAAPTEQDYEKGEEAYRIYQAERATVQKWKSSAPLPERLTDIGFVDSYSVVYVAIWGEPGTVGYLFKDSQGVYFGVSVREGHYYDSKQKKVIELKEPIYFVGGLHPEDAGVVRVPGGSGGKRFVDLLFSGRKSANPAAGAKR